MKFNTLYCVLAAMGAGALAASAHADGDWKFDLHGFVSTSGYVQSEPSFVLNGQGPLLLLNETNNSGATTTGFDIRQSRLRFELSGPKVLGGAATKAIVETDFFNLNGPGGYGEISLVPRLRLAYGELNWGDTTLRVGQDWELLFNEYPTSLAHLAFPVTYFAGLSGWRDVGAAIYHKTAVGDGSLEGAFSIQRSDWENPFDFGQTTNADLNVSAGQLSALPGFEVRGKYTSGDNDVYIAGHWSQVDGSRIQNLASTANFPAINTRNFMVMEGKIGGKYVYQDWTIKGDVYIGKNTTPLIGESLQWFTANDVMETGGWGQIGYNINKNWSIWGTYGQARSSLSNVNSAGGGRWKNAVWGGMIMYKDGPFAVGPECYHVETNTTATSNGGAPDGDMQAYQALLTANLYF